MKDKVICLNCSLEFEKEQKEIKRNPNHFCSKSCSAAFNNKKRGKTTVACYGCGKEIKRQPHQIKKYNNSFCSRACCMNHKRQTVLSDWKEGKTSGASGKGGTASVIKEYILQKQHYSCLICGITNWNDKPLTLQLDHIDGNCTNNAEENLRCLCPNCHTQTENWGARNPLSSGRYYRNRKE